MLDWLVQAWGEFTRADIRTSFECCGQSLNGSPAQITCLKEGKTQEAVFQRVVDVWDKMDTEIEVEETADLEEEYANEMVIEGDNEQEEEELE